MEIVRVCDYLETSLEVNGVHNNFFCVQAKCGHVGKGLYYKGKFYIRAKNARRAAEVVRRFPRVKHDYQDAILSVSPISYKEYVKGQQDEYSKAYYNCLSKQDQMEFWDDISEDVYLDDHLTSLEEKRMRTKKHSLKNNYNLDPLYFELKGYQGNINYQDII